MVVAAWGALRAARGRAAEVTAMLQAAGVELHCLGITLDGHPLHPSRIAATVRPVPWRPLALACGATEPV
jgi:hypothetical protein